LTAGAGEVKTGAMADTPAPERSPCVNCGAGLLGRFCHACGEKQLGPRDRSLLHYFGGLIEAVLNLEGKLLKTVLTLVRRPGQLTADYWQGRRVPYMKPLPLFLLANVLYFLLASWTGLTAVPFSFIVRKPMNVALIEYKLDVAEGDRAEFRRIAASYARDPRGVLPATEPARTFERYARSYSATAPALSRSLVLIMIAMVTPLLALAELRRRRRFTLVAHLVFATHLMTVFLLAFLATEWFWRLVSTLWRLVRGSGAGLFGNDSLWAVAPLILAVGVYLYQGLQRFYEDGRAAAAAKAVLLVVGISYVFRGYQKLLFFVTLLFT
jgi:hypothetical protein